MHYIFNNLKGSVQRVKRTLAVLLAVVFVLAIATPAFAMFHTATYEMEGVINFKKQAGHYCNTGAEFKQTIAGSGKMDKVQTVTMVKGKITMADTNDWVAGATPLTVTSVWKLCTPPKYTYNTDVMINGGALYDAGNHDVPVAASSIFGLYSMPAEWHQGKNSPFYPGLGGTLVGVTHDMMAEAFGWDAVSEQYWAVQVQADPGFSGNLHQKGEAAYGKYWGIADNDYEPWNSDDGWANNKDKWRWELNDGVFSREVGADYVGDYFNMEQMARTSQGTLKRYIDISSPWTGAYLHEDMSVVGKSMITEAFRMPNVPAGADIVGDWWRLF